MDKLTFKTVGLPCGKEGSSPLQTTNLFNGQCPHACVYCYSTNFKGYTDQTTQAVNIEAVKNVKRWPRRLFLSSSSDPFHPSVINIAEQLLKDALAAGTFVVISTKALATNEVVEILSRHTEQVSYTISLSTMDNTRNRLLEPNAPSANERLYGKTDADRTLYGVKQLVQNGVKVTLKADTLFPGIDDTDDSILQLLEAARECGITSVNFSYAFYRKKFKGRLEAIPLLRNALREMTEYQPIASGKGYSLPLSEKAKRLSHMGQIAGNLGFNKVTACKCKNQVTSLSGCDHMELDCHFHHKWF
jgi:DNA repair photolyase